MSIGFPGTLSAYFFPSAVPQLFINASFLYRQGGIFASVRTASSAFGALQTTSVLSIVQNLVWCSILAFFVFHAS
jgi:hypothetical protein